MFEELNVEISHQEINKGISQLKNSRSGGPDLILNEFLIHGKDTLMPFFHTLFNVAFNHVMFSRFMVRRTYYSTAQER